MNDPDAPLVSAVQEGDATAVSILYRRYVTHVYAYIRRRVSATEVAEDLTSETFLAVVNGLRSFRGSATFRTWLYQIARRRIADFWRKQYALPECASELVLQLLAAPDRPNEDEEEEASMRSNIDVERVLRELPENHRRVLECRFLERKSIRETAEELSLTEGNVKVIQHRAIRQASDIAQRL